MSIFLKMLFGFFRFERTSGREIFDSMQISQSLRSIEMTFILFLFIQNVCYSQTDWVRWEKSDPSYQVQDSYLERNYDLSIESASDLIIKPVINTYWFFISDVDGANCPFEPSCSSFLVESIKETNPVQGLLMFFDRFTRDTNVYGRQKHYPSFDGKHFYDPVTLYTLDEDNIKFIPANTYLNEE